MNDLMLRAELLDRLTGESADPAPDDLAAQVATIARRIENARRTLAQLSGEDDKSMKTKQVNMPAMTPEQMAALLDKLGQRLDHLEAFLTENFGGAFQPVKPADKALKAPFWPEQGGQRR